MKAWKILEYPKDIGMIEINYLVDNLWLFSFSTQNSPFFESNYWKFC